MDALQAIASAKEIVSCMIGAIGALERASRNLDEAPKRIQNLEDFADDLKNLIQRIKQKHADKLHNPQLDFQIQSLNSLIKRLRPNIKKAKRIVSSSKFKNLAKVVWISVAGDPLEKLVNSIKDDLNCWLEYQRLRENIEKVMESTAQNIPVKLKIKTEQGYPISSKCNFVRTLLEEESSHRVILIVGLSGIGKSCLARQIASDPPMKFEGGAVELGFGQWCSRAACNGSKDEYQRRLGRKICKFLVLIGFWKKIRDENSEDLDDMCCLLQKALCGKSILILLDDVWEEDIVERFAKLYDNNCRYLVTTRNEAVYEIAEAQKVELNKDDTKEISKAMLFYHTLLSEEEVPDVAESLLQRCGHHPLTVAVMGKALRKETRAEKWEKAISNLSAYATCARGPLSYVNEKEGENTLTIFRSLEFSLEAMPEDSRGLFIALAALSWAEPVPEACLEAIWSVVGQENLFPLVVSKLVEGSLLMKTDSFHLYQVHDMVSLYLDHKTNDSVEIIFSQSNSEEIAFISPWLFTFGKETVKKIAEQRIEFSLSLLEEKHAVVILEAIIQALMASKSISELEASRASFSSILGSRMVNLISSNSHRLIAMTAKAITVIFSKSDYNKYFPSLETIGAVDKLAGILENSDDPMIQTNISIVLAKLAEFGSSEIVDEALQSIPFNQLADLLSPKNEEWHESVFTTLMSLIKTGKSKAVERMYGFEIDKSLIKLLENGSEVAQHHSIVTLKACYEVGGPPANGSLEPGNLNLLPWQVRLSLERFVLSDRISPLATKSQTFEDLVHKVLNNDSKQVLEAMQDLIPIIEKARDPRIRNMILQSALIKRLSELLQHGHPGQNSITSESAFLLTKLACSGGEPCIKKFLEYDIIPELVKLMQCNVPELQDSSYTALHQMLIGNGGGLIVNQILQMGLIESFAYSLDSKSRKTREVNMHCILDLVELGNKVCLEQMLSLQVVEKLARIEKSSGGSGKALVGFLEGIDKCKYLLKAERKVMKQQVVGKMRTPLKGHKREAQILASLDGCVSEGFRGSTSSSGRQRR